MNKVKDNFDLAKAYEPSKFEGKIYRLWENSGYFNPDNLPGKGKPFVIAMPPANVTGILHIGHILEHSLMDTTIRYQRFKGRKALLVPGTDHAAVATQARVEKDLIESGKYKNPRQELGREKLLKIIREYADKSQSTILSQIRKLGTSCDWSRLAYTFDADRSQAVNAAFKKMYDDGLVYRGFRVVNWSVKGQSTCSDDEIVHQEQPGKFYYFKYSDDFPITIATTRPETKLGDTAVAVNPKDSRYKKYIGKVFKVDIGAQAPLEIKIIGDKEVDPKFGTGALGVTPAHSQVDYEMYESRKGKQDEIKLIQVIDASGRMTASAGKNYQGLTVAEARTKFVSWLQKNNLLQKEEDVTQNVGCSDRFGDVVEVLPMEQWFVAVNKIIPGRNKTLKDLMREAVTKGHQGRSAQKVEIQPANFAKIYLHWIDNLRDWCISRQIWWGHQIPVWYTDDRQIIVATSEIEAKKIAQGKKITRDSDTLDTWFSSGLWTFSTLGWPDKTPDLKLFHPTDWIQMGYEILFFWMARMIMMSTYLLDQVPFKDVYIHGMVRDKEGRKYSKSLRNATDPQEMIDKYGTDALRLAVMIGSGPGQDMRLYDEKIAGYRNFVNKLWNISRFIFGQVKTVKHIAKQPAAKTLADKWILSEFNSLIKQITADLDKYNFSAAGERLYEFTWSKLADWYLEIAKVEGKKDEILLYILERLLILWHPFTPFITEVIYRQFSAKDLLMVQSWPQAGKIDTRAINDFIEVQKVVTKIRNVRMENKIPPIDFIDCYLENKKLGKNEKLVIAKLARINLVEDKIKSPVISTGQTKIYLQAVKKMSPAELESLEKYILSLQAKLANQQFTEHAPAAVIKEAEEKLKLARKKLLDQK